ncbi:hypothetical protein MRX96_004750 [Rhipicephalus microplus]
MVHSMGSRLCGTLHTPTLFVVGEEASGRLRGRPRVDIAAPSRRVIIDRLCVGTKRQPHKLLHLAAVTHSCVAFRVQPDTRSRERESAVDVRAVSRVFGVFISALSRSLFCREKSSFVSSSARVAVSLADKSLVRRRDPRSAYLRSSAVAAAYPVNGIPRYIALSLRFPRFAQAPPPPSGCARD